MTCSPYMLGDPFGRILHVTSSTRPTGSDRYTGQVIYETDTFRTLQYNGSVWLIINEPWQSYTPQIDQGASTNIAKTVLYSKYRRQGYTLEWNFRLNMTGSGSSGSAIRINGAPGAAAYSSSAPGGMFMFYDASAPTTYIGIIQVVTTTGFELLPHGSTGTNLGAGFGIANNDILEVVMSYEYVPT